MQYLTPWLTKRVVRASTGRGKSTLVRVGREKSTSSRLANDQSCAWGGTPSGDSQQPRCVWEMWGRTACACADGFETFTAGHVAWRTRLNFLSRPPHGYTGRGNEIFSANTSRRHLTAPDCISSSTSGPALPSTLDRRPSRRHPRPPIGASSAPSPQHHADHGGILAFLLD